MKHLHNSLGSVASKFGKARSFFSVALLSAAGLLALAAPAHAQETTSQATSEQLNQLFGFETTPNKSATGEGYVNGQFRYLKFPGDLKQYLFELQGQYSFTDQIAAGMQLPIEDVKLGGRNGGSHSGISDIVFYGQYKLDQLVNHDIIDLTAQLDLSLPTGKASEGLGTGHVGLRPLILAYKGLEAGPGVLGAYGLLGVTITTNPDVRMGLAGTYDYEKIVGILEFDDLAGDKIGRPLVTITPGVAYHGLNPFEFALGFPFGINDGSPDWGIVIKATFAFQR